MSTKRKASKKQAPLEATKGKVSKPVSPAAEVQLATEKFNRDLLIRGDAALVGADGKLPLEATHEIVETNKDSDQGQPALKRRRFKMY